MLYLNSSYRYLRATMLLLCYTAKSLHEAYRAAAMGCRHRWYRGAESSFHTTLSKGRSEAHCYERGCREGKERVHSREVAGVYKGMSTFFLITGRKSLVFKWCFTQCSALFQKDNWRHWFGRRIKSLRWSPCYPWWAPNSCCSWSSTQQSTQQARLFIFKRTRPTRKKQSGQCRQDKWARRRRRWSRDWKYGALLFWAVGRKGRTRTQRGNRYRAETTQVRAWPPTRVCITIHYLAPCH